MKSVVHGLEMEYRGMNDFVYLDVDNSATVELRQTLGFRSQPHFILLDGGGKVLGQWFGFVEPAIFRAAFEGL